MKKIWVFILATSLGLYSCSFESFDKKCEREAREFTAKQCPRRLDPGTIMDSLTFNVGTRSLQYCYTVDGELDNDLVMQPELLDDFREELLKNVINSVDLKQYKEKEITFEYIYFSKATGKKRLHLTFTPKDYEQQK